jgi:hypothetical protein
MRRCGDMRFACAGLEAARGTNESRSCCRPDVLWCDDWFSSCSSRRIPALTVLKHMQILLSYTQGFQEFIKYAALWSLATGCRLQRLIDYYYNS